MSKIPPSTFHRAHRAHSQPATTGASATQPRLVEACGKLPVSLEIITPDRPIQPF